MNTFKFRAECRIDVARAMQKIYFDSLTMIPLSVAGLSVPDVEVELSSPDSLEMIIEKLSRIPDGHVMLETVNLKHAYSGERLERRK